jgi:hypothetical protein
VPTVDNIILQILACALVSVLCAYGGGRVHQWYMHSMDRDQSFRDGYNHGYRALFAIAARNSRPSADSPIPTDRHDRSNHRRPKPFRD